MKNSISKQLLSYWHKLEHFTPAVVPNDAKKCSGKLPWEDCNQHPDSSKQYEYIVYFGVFLLNEVTEFVQEFFHSKSKNPNQLSSKVCYASLRVDESGKFISKSFGLSTLPWALTELKEKRLNQNLPLDEFKEKERKIIEFLLDEILKDTLTWENLQQIQTYLLEGLHWKDLHSASIYISKEERIKTKKDSNEGDANHCDLLNSFYIEDLERIIKSLETKKIPTVLKDYLKGCLNEVETDKRHDLSAEPSVLKQCVTPEHYPNGCWPSPYRASLMQQFAINRVMDDLSGKKQEGLFSVNGPPGTGKTTLLRDIIAAILVKRAQQMIQFSDPAKAFSKLKESEESSGYVPFIYEPSASICDGGIVVASSNNGAVENISKELPLKKEVKGYADQLGYFRTVSEGCVNEEHWGLIAAVMGSKKNQRNFIDSIWNTRKNAKKQTLYQSLDKEIAPSLDQWEAVKSSFENKLNEVSLEKERLIMWQKKNAQCNNLPQMMKDAKTRELKLATELQSLESILSETQSTYKQQQLAVNEANRELEQIIRTRPNWLTCLINKKKRTSYQDCQKEVVSKIDLLKQQVNESEKELQTHKKNLSDKREELENAKNKSECYSTLAKIRDELNGAYTDDSFCKNIDSKDAQEKSPWYSEELKKLESELFVEAMKVNECFLLMANKSGNRIRSTLDRFFKFLKSGGELDERQIKAMWNTFWLVVPVVSSTFASIHRMFGSMGPGCIPWLFIDEAGQAVPQAAAGAIWRCKRAVVVGDPFQIEPVVTTPDAIAKELGNHFGLKCEQYDNTLSVQRMADRINKYGWTMNETWVGSPLRVHRRCDDPMFSIANNIAYGNKMFNSTIKSTPKLKMKTAFISVTGNVKAGCRHYVAEQGEIIRKIILDEINHQQTLPDLFVISPFSEIPLKLRSDLEKHMNVAVANLPQQMDDKKVKDWLNTHIGTVHTFQGKQAEGVILCLGLDSTMDGAANWAASKPNLLNVALTRAKLRFVAVGDANIWLSKNYFDELSNLTLIKVADHEKQ